LSCLQVSNWNKKDYQIYNAGGLVDPNPFNTLSEGNELFLRQTLLFLPKLKMVKEVFPQVFFYSSFLLDSWGASAHGRWRTNKRESLTFSDSWLRDQAFRFHDNIKISLELRAIETSSYKSCRQGRPKATVGRGTGA